MKINLIIIFSPHKKTNRAERNMKPPTVYYCSGMMRPDFNIGSELKSLRLSGRVVGKKGAGTQGWGEGVRASEGWGLNRSWAPSSDSKQRRDLWQRQRKRLCLSILWTALVDSSATRPNHGWSCTETVPLCTNAHQRRQQNLSSPPHYTHRLWRHPESVPPSNAADSDFSGGFFAAILTEAASKLIKEFFNQPGMGFVVLCVVKLAKLGSLFLLSTMLSFTWPRSSTPPSTHSRPTERFSAASAFQIRHNNTKKKTNPDRLHFSSS